MPSKRTREEIFDDDDEFEVDQDLKDRVAAIEAQSTDDEEKDGEQDPEPSVPIAAPEEGIDHMLDDEEILDMLRITEKEAEPKSVLIEVPSKEKKNKEVIKVNAQSLEQLKKKIQILVMLLLNWKHITKKIPTLSGQFKSRKDLLNDLAHTLSNVYGYSIELAEYLLDLFSPSEAIDFVESMEKPQMTTIRTNTLKTRRKALAQALIGRGVNLDPVGDWTKIGLKVYNTSVPLGATPEYLGGHYMIQSASSWVPVMALDPQPGESILDMAAAPGGKSTHIGQLMNNEGILYCNELKTERLPSLTANLHRMGISNSIVMNYDGKKLRKRLPQFDRVLLDAPCSGLGIISRDPSVKTKRGVQDFKENAGLQKELLQAAIDMTKTGGTIVYSTCSLSVEENEMVLDHTLKNRHVRIMPIPFNVGSPALPSFKAERFNQTVTKARRIYPHIHNMDGFFVCKMVKLSERCGMKRDRRKGLPSEVSWNYETTDEKFLNGFCDFGNPPSQEPTPEPSKKAAEKVSKKAKAVMAKKEAKPKKKKAKTV